MVLSLDANALYPSLDVQKTSRIVARRVVESNLKFNDVNYTWAAKYIALNLSRTEIIKRVLYRIILRKKATGGMAPSVLTITTDQKKERWKWITMPDKYTETDRRKVMESVVQILIEATFSNHFYKWGENIYKQLEGGAIGLRATGSVARAIMGHILEEVKDIMVQNNMPVHLLKK